MQTVITSVAQLWRDAQKYTWELYKAPYRLDNGYYDKSGAKLENGRYVRRVTKIQTNGLYLGTAFLDKPKASEVSFHHYTPGGSIPTENSTFKNHVIVTIRNKAGEFCYHLRPDIES